MGKILSVAERPITECWMVGKLWWRGYWSDGTRNKQWQKGIVTAHVRLVESQSRANCLGRVCYKVSLTFSKLPVGIGVRNMTFTASDYTKKATLPEPNVVPI